MAPLDRSGRLSPVGRPPLSVLKPVHGRDPRFYEAILSHAAQDYPEFELLFGLTDPHDPAIADIERLQREFPARRISIVVVETDAPNAKVGVMAELARHARYPKCCSSTTAISWWTPGYFRTVVAPLNDPQIGLVTCLYRAHSESWASHFEALGIATEFAPSVLVARLLGQAEFALGSTMVFRADALAPHRRLSKPSPNTWPTITSSDSTSASWAIASSSRPWWSRRTWERVLGAHLAPPVALVADHPGLAPRRLLRLRGDPRHPVGAGGLRRAPVVGRRASR